MSQNSRSEGTITLTSPSTSATKVINVSQKADVFSTSSSTVNVGYSVNSEAEFTYSSTYDVSVSVSDDTKLDAVDVDGTVLVSVKVANSSAEDVELGKIILTRNTGITDEHKTIEVTVIQKSAPAPLSQPTITATPSSTSVALEWEKIGQSIGYEVWIDPEKKVSINDKLLLTYTFEDLTPDTEYTAYIVAKGDGLNYADSPSASVVRTPAGERQL